MLTCVALIGARQLKHQSVERVAILDYLISAGADADAVDDRVLVGDSTYTTPLVTSMQRYDVDSSAHPVLDLATMKPIDAGANLNARDENQMRPLDFAAQLPSLDVFKALIAEGADPSPVPNIVERMPGQPNEGHTLGVHYLQTTTQNGRADVLQAAAAAGVDLKKARSLGPFRAP